MHSNQESHSRRQSDVFMDISPPPSAQRARVVKRQKRIQADIPEHYQTAPSSSSYSSQAFARSNSGGNRRRPLSFIATFASKVKNAFEGWQDSSTNRNSARLSFNDMEFESNSDSSPNCQKRPVNTHPARTRTSSDRLSVNMDKMQGRQPVRKTYSCDQTNQSMNPSFAEVMEILNVPPSPELERCTPFEQQVANYVTDDNWTHCGSDVNNDQHYDSIKAPNSTKSDADINVLVIGAEGVGKTALIVRYLTKRFIGEYASNSELMYDHAISIDGKEVSINIWDSGIPQMLQKSSESDTDLFNLAGSLSLTPTSLNSSERSSSSSSAYDNRISSSSFEEEQSPSRLDEHHLDKKSKRRKKGKKEVNNNYNKLDKMRMRLHWCDCVVVVYSVCDNESFESARDVIRYIRGLTVRGHSFSKPSSPATSPQDYADSQVPLIKILLIGNKADLQHRRKVKQETVEAFCQGYNCLEEELSVSEDFESVSRAFDGIIESTYRQKWPSRLTKIKSIVRTVSRSTA